MSTSSEVDWSQDWKRLNVTAKSDDAKAMLAGLKQLGRYSVLERMEALDTLLVYTTNLVNFPSEEKYRKIKLSNIHFQDRLGHLEGSTACMRAIGYHAADDYLRLKEAKMSNKQESKGQLLEIQVIIKTILGQVHSEFNKPAPHHGEGYQFSSVVAAAAHGDIGPRRKSMEDDEVILDKFCGDPSQGYFAVYDGHGGRQTVDYVVKALHLNIAHMMKSNPDEAMHSIYNAAYVKTDAQLRRQNIFRSGTTSVSCLIRREENVDDPSSSQQVLYTANTGDSRAVLFRGNTALRLTIDHKPTLPEEAKRIEEAGGKVVRDRVNGVLAVSRALGDHMLKDNFIVSPEPYCTRTVITQEDSMLLLACDGVWDVISDQKACEFVQATYLNMLKLKQDAFEPINHTALLHDCCKALIAESVRLKTQDNITVMIIKLN